MTIKKPATTRKKEVTGKPPKVRIKTDAPVCSGPPQGAGGVWVHDGISWTQKQVPTGSGTWRLIWTSAHGWDWEPVN